MKKEYKIFQLIWLFPFILVISIFDAIVIFYAFDYISTMDVIYKILLILCGVLGPFVVLVYSIIFGMQCMIINTKEIKISLFNLFFRRRILWRDVNEITVIKHNAGAFGWICISKIPLSDLDYNSILNNRNVIKIQNTKRNRDILGKFEETDFETIQF